MGMDSKRTPKPTVDLRRVLIDADAPAAARLDAYLSQVTDPYAYRVGDVDVNVRYTEGGKCLGDILQAYLSSLKDDH